MPTAEIVLRVLIASPGDVVPERNLVEEVIGELNRAWSKELGFRLQAIRWEIDVAPGVGADPQAVVNQQIGNDYDILLGIFWSRFGTPTGRASSGTEEEFERAYNRHQTDSASVSVMLYFKDAPIAPSQLDLVQLQALALFKNGLSQKGVLYHTFVESGDLGALLRVHLTHEVQEWKRRLEGDGKMRIGPTPTSDSDVIASLVAPASDQEEDADEQGDDLGLFELQDQTEESVGRMNSVLVEIGQHVLGLAAEMSLRTAELQDAANRLDRNVARQISDRAARDLNAFAEGVERQLVGFSESTSIAFTALGRSASLYLDFGEAGLENVRDLLVQVRVLRPGLASSRQQTRELGSTVGGLPRVTTSFNRAKARVLRVLSALDQHLMRAESMAFELERVVLRLLEDRSDASGSD